VGSCEYSDERLGFCATKFVHYLVNHQNIVAVIISQLFSNFFTFGSHLEVNI
jgi:hypothetical protein